MPNANKVLNLNDELQLDPQIKANLQTPEDFSSYAIQLSQDETSVSWKLADLFVAYQDKFGKPDLFRFAAALGKRPSTVDNYVRTALGFPPENREINLSFTHHMEASFIDSFDNGNFLTDKRFDVISAASVTMPSTREMKATITEKKRLAEGGKLSECYFCGEEDIQVKKYIFYAPDTGDRATKMNLHFSCFTSIIKLIDSHAQGHQ